jgi:nitrite reductase/ring-hydroxylating ferredoxin subunit
MRWVEDVEERLHIAMRQYCAHAHADYNAIPQGLDRKAFAAEAVTSPYRAALFRLYDGRSIDALAWKAVRPSGDVGFAATEES